MKCKCNTFFFQFHNPILDLDIQAAHKPKVCPHSGKAGRGHFYQPLGGIIIHGSISSCVGVDLMNLETGGENQFSFATRNGVRLDPCKNHGNSGR